jgi:hypothetical protein
METPIYLISDILLDFEHYALLFSFKWSRVHHFVRLDRGERSHLLDTSTINKDARESLLNTYSDPTFSLACCEEGSTAINCVTLWLILTKIKCQKYKYSLNVKRSSGVPPLFIALDKSALKSIHMGISDFDLFAIIQMCGPQLTCLNVFNVSSFTDELILKLDTLILRNLTELTFIYAGVRLTEAAITHLSLYCESLRVFRCGICPMSKSTQTTPVLSHSRKYAQTCLQEPRPSRAERGHCRVYHDCWMSAAATHSFLLLELRATSPHWNVVSQAFRHTKSRYISKCRFVNWIRGEQTQTRRTRHSFCDELFKR